MLKPNIVTMAVISVHIVINCLKHLALWEFTTITITNSNQVYCFADVDQEINSKLYKNECGEWVCTDCGYTKKKKSHVYEHVDIKHSSHEGYLCNICNEVLRSKAQLGRHQSQMHHWNNSFCPRCWKRDCSENVQRGWSLEMQWLWLLF